VVSERDRHELYVAAEGALGQQPASTLMELLPPVDWNEIARKSDIAGVRGEISELRGELREFKGEMREFKGEMRAEISALHARIDVLLPRIVLANLAMMIALVGLVFTIARATAS
jgi:hypothetical protein